MARLLQLHKGILAGYKYLALEGRIYWECNTDCVEHLHPW